MEIRKSNSTVYRIIEAYGYQVVGKFGTLILSSLNKEYDVVTDVAIIDMETNKIIYKNSMCNTSPTRESLFDGIEAFLYFIRKNKPDEWLINSVFRRVFEDHRSSAFIFQMNNLIKYDIEKAKRIDKLENDIQTEKDALEYAESKGYTVTDVHGCTYALKFDTEESKKAFLNLPEDYKASALNNDKLKRFTFVKSFEDISLWSIDGKSAHTNMEQLYRLI